MQGTSHSTDFLLALSYLVLVDFLTAYFPVLCPCLPPGSPPNTFFNPVFILKIALWRIDYRGQVSGEARDQWGVFLSVSRCDSVGGRMMATDEGSVTLCAWGYLNVQWLGLAGESED